MQEYPLTWHHAARIAGCACQLAIPAHNPTHGAARTAGLCCTLIPHSAASWLCMLPSPPAPHLTGQHHVLTPGDVPRASWRQTRAA